jgi:alkanesulfonate monooxygenase SsuD/methylene tetrahydromethanopterin reductase-like flavin-dependent oxidoreductase (luciferase family)
MQLVLMTEPQMGGTYEDLLFAAKTADDAGLAGFSRSDHYYWSGKPGLPVTDAFTSLGGIARETRRVRLGVLVSPITFRHPAVLAKSAASIDEMSGGRFDLGVGTGWMEAEHEAFGLPFPSQKDRFARLTEALQYLRAAFDGGSFDGQFFSFNADSRPRPSGVRLLVGGSGPEKTPTLAGRFADEYNHTATAPEKLAAKIEVMKEAARDAGRNPDEITVSVMGPAMLAPSDGRLSELMTAAAAVRNVSVTELEERWNSARVPRGTPERAADAMAAFSSVGVDKYYFQWFDLPDRAGVAEQVELAARLKL